MYNLDWIFWSKVKYLPYIIDLPRRLFSPPSAMTYVVNKRYSPIFYLHQSELI